jgi:uncharacterized membrane protein YvlD (DUF360 family)
MRNLFIRALIAVVCVVILFALLGPVLNILGFPLSGDLLTIFRIVVAVIALYYIVWGPSPSIPPG